MYFMTILLSGNTIINSDNEANKTTSPISEGNISRPTETFRSPSEIPRSPLRDRGTQFGNHCSKRYQEYSRTLQSVSFNLLSSGSTMNMISYAMHTARTVMPISLESIAATENITARKTSLHLVGVCVGL